MPITARHKALAAEALIRIPDLAPAARRLGLELLNHADRNTGLAWPSEARMAEALGVDPRTIRRGKAALRAAGLLTWRRRGTSRNGRTPVYSLAWEKLLQIATVIKARVQAACSAARKAIKAVRTTTPPAAAKRPDRAPTPSVGRTFSPACLTQKFKINNRGGFWKAPTAPKGQHLADEQLVAKASARFWTALQALGPQVMAQFISHPYADKLQDQAIRAERFQPAHGRTGVLELQRLLNTSTA